MSKRAVHIAGVLALLVAASMLAMTLIGGKASSSAAGKSKSPEQGKSKVLPVKIRVFPLDDRRPKGYSPKLLVVIANESQDMIYLERYLGSVEPWSRNALRARVIDRGSGRRAPTRTVGDYLFTGWRESRFVGVEARHAYGPIVDLRNDFILRPGRDYKVQFTYSTPAPSKVGHVRPWKGTAVSDEIVVAVP
jgi:hypothetical protein